MVYNVTEPFGYSMDGAAHYHYGKFPPTNLKYELLIKPLGDATAALARYDALLSRLHNKDLLLTPLRGKEAVVTSRIEGTVATLDEVLRIQADVEEDGDEQSYNAFRGEAIEVYSYTRALKHAQALMNQGLPICSRLIRESHARLLFYGRGSDKSPGDFKSDQNFVVDRTRKMVLFVPISAQQLSDGIRNFEEYINRDDLDVLIQTALAHLEFEALHPFKDGNGRVGRMLITLNLWAKKRISGPHFYISECLEENRDEYIDRMRRASSHDEWTDWVVFFLEAIRDQAHRNCQAAEAIYALYEEMKVRFHEALSSQWSTHALDYIFAKCVFRNSAFTKNAGIPSQSAHRITKSLADAQLLTVVVPASGRRSALYAFQPLIKLISP